MPWKEQTAVDERKAFIAAWQRKEQSFTALCRIFGVSRPTGYKWLERYQSDGETALADLSRAPLFQPRAMPETLRSRILELRAQHPTWGPKKLKARLERVHPNLVWPACSIMGELLRREGLAQPRPQAPRTLAYSAPLAHAQAPNDVWCADFKGCFLCRNGQRCDPFTLTDA